MQKIMKPAQFKRAGSFLLRLGVVYILLILPWPGFNEAYGTFFRTLVSPVFSMDKGERELDFHSMKSGDGSNLIRIEIVNRVLMAPDGSGPVRNFDIDPRGFWRATALLIALVVATPIGWWRRCWAMLWGILAIQGFILVVIGFSLWNESRYVDLVKLSPFMQSAADKIQNMLASQFNIALPVLLWLVVTFRSEDAKKFKLWLAYTT